MAKTTQVSLKQHVQSSVRDGVYTNVNIGMAESYFCAFMLALGISEVTAGFGTVLAQFIGVVFQLFSIRSFFRRFSLKNRILLFLTVQALSMLPMILMAYFQTAQKWQVIAVLGTYWAALLSLNPPWNRLMGHTVPIRFRIKFFSIRNQFTQLSILIGLVIGGIFLHKSKSETGELKVFTWIFVVGFFLKCLSWIEVKFLHKEHEIAPLSEVRLRLRDFVKRLKNTEQGKLIRFLFFFYISVHFAAPYFGPYMLGTLKFNYVEYMMATAVSYMGRVIIFKFLQKRARPHHINKLLLFAVIGISTSPFCWAVSQSYAWIIAIELLSGCFWAAFELSTILLYYERVQDHERTSVMTYITFFNVLGMLIGSTLGAIFMRNAPLAWDNYVILFIFSGFLRILSVLIVPNVDFRSRIPQIISFNRVFMVLPPFGALTKPFIEKYLKKKK